MGASGVHSFFEEYQPSCVRRRCLNHLAWTVAKQALEEIGMALVSALSTYLNSALSTTWFQLKVIATHSRVQGGLGLLAEGSREYHAVFSEMLGTIDKDRPESVMDFLRLL